MSYVSINYIHFSHLYRFDLYVRKLYSFCYNFEDSSTKDKRLECKHIRLRIYEIKLKVITLHLRFGIPSRLDARVQKTTALPPDRIPSRYWPAVGKAREWWE